MCKTFLKSKVTFAGEKVDSAKNNFLGAGTLTCVTREWYGIWQIGLHHDVHRRSHFTMVSITRHVKCIANGQFSQIWSHTYVLTHLAMVAEFLFVQGYQAHIHMGVNVISRL